MATGGALSGSDQVYREILQAIDRYELKHFLHEAKDKCVISEKEKQEIEQQSNGQRMRKHLIRLAFRSERQQQLVEFIYYYTNLVQRISVESLARVSVLQTMKTRAHRVDHSQDGPQLSQDIASSSDAGSQAKIYTDMGYYSNSSRSNDSRSPCSTQNYSQPTCSDIEYLESGLKVAQGVQHNLQSFIDTKEQQNLSANCQFASKSKPRPNTNVFNIHMTSYNYTWGSQIGSSSERKGCHNQVKHA